MSRPTCQNPTGAAKLDDSRAQQTAPATPDATQQRLTRSATHVGGATFVSRLLGFVRDVLMAKFFGTGAPAEAFVVAFRLPNLFRELVAEGAGSAAFVPTLSATHATRDRAHFTHVVNVFVTAVAVCVGLGVLVAILIAPWLVRLLAPGFLQDTAKWELTVTLTRLLLPYLWAMSIVAVTTSALHTLQRFRTPAWNPVLLNIAMITACLVWVPYRSAREGAIVVAISILIAGVAQIILNEVSLWRSGLRYQPRWHWQLAELRHAGELLLPRLFGAAVYQMGVLLDTIMASFSAIVGVGGVAALYYASRLLQFPLGLFGVSMAVVSLPTLAQQVARGEVEAFKSTVVMALRSVTAVMVPATVGLFLLSAPIIEVLFQRGAFDAQSTQLTVAALRWSVVGLLAFAATKIFVNAFYALHDTRTPVRWALIGLGLNLIFNLLLMRPMGLGGLALGTSLAAICECVGLWHGLERRVGHLDRRTLATTGRRVGLAAAVMGLATWAGWFVGIVPRGWHGGPAILGLLGVIIISIALFIVVGRRCQVVELEWLLTRRSPRA